MKTKSFTTNSKHPLNRIYERLRKRSQRERYIYGVTPGFSIACHQAYTEGVNDTLRAVQEEVLPRY